MSLQLPSFAEPDTEAERIALRRAKSQSRAARFLDSRARTMGVDVAYLKQQVEERKARERIRDKVAQNSMEPKGRLWLHGPRGRKIAAGKGFKQERRHPWIHASSAASLVATTNGAMEAAVAPYIFCA